MKRLASLFLSLALLCSGAFGQLALTGAGKAAAGGGGGGGGGSVAQYRGTSEATNVASGNPPVAIAGHAIGDLMYCYAHGQAAFTADGNWTTLDNSQDPNSGNYQYIALRVATTSDGSGADRCNPTYTGSNVGIYTFSFSGVDGSTPHEQFGLTQWAGTSATVFPPNATPSVADAVHIVAYGESSNPYSVTTAPAGYTQIVVNSAGGARVAVYYKKLSGQSGVAQGPINLVWSGTAYGPAWTAVAK